MDGRKKLKPPLLVAKGLWVDYHVDLLAYDSFGQESLMDVPIVLARSVFKQYDQRAYEKTSSIDFLVE